MTCVVTDPCINCQYGECLDVCPADAFHRGPNFMVINPHVCINCTLCVLACPVQAIASDYELSPDRRHYIALNDELSQIWPVAASGAPALPDADHWAQRRDKHALLVR
ncbi:ferredoxin family protein [Alcaligenes sp. WGS1538]|uniref:ferredoxin family protein n=1 Tax=Alcaligenes sp. WGS1538 TaxID=3366811 RepID=UPI00372D0C54